MKFCTKCGAELFDDAVICTKCGRMLESPAQARGNLQQLAPLPTTATYPRQKAAGTSLFLSVVNFLFWIFSLLSLFFIKLRENILEVLSKKSLTLKAITETLEDTRLTLLVFATVFAALTLILGTCSFVLALLEKQKADRVLSGIAKIFAGILLLVFAILLIV